MGESLKDIATLSPTKRALFEFLLQEKGVNVSKIPKIPRGKEAESFALSFAQQRLWFLDLLEPGNPVYNETTAVRLTGALNPPALEYSLNEIVRRHEILRTTFTAADGEPVQMISPAERLTLSLVDLRAFSSEQREAELKRLSAEQTNQPFDLTKWPLIRASLFQLDETEFVLLLVIHHIVTDGWSGRVLLHEMADIYEAHCAGLPSPLPELPVQYADFAQWQRQWFAGEVLEKQLAYWKQQLGGRLPVLELPTDRPRPALQTFRGDRESVVLSPQLGEAIKTLSRNSGVTLFMTLLAAFQTLLYRHTGQEDILVGSPLAGRNRSEIERLIGFFINTLVLRSDLSGNPSFQELLQRVRQVALGAYAHQDMPFEKLVEELHPDRDLSRTPLFQVFFNLINFEQNRIEMRGVTVESLPRPEQESKFDITLYARELRQGMQLEFVYNADLFDAARMREMLEQFQCLLEQIVENPAQKLADFSLVTPSAAGLLPNPTQALIPEWFGAVHDRFSQQAARVPERLAVADKYRVLTYAELDDISNKLANYLRSQGIGSEEIVAIYAHRSAALIWALLGILKAGAAFVILDANYPAERLINCLQLAQPKGWLQVQAAGELPPSLEAFVAALSPACRLELPETADFLEAYSAENPGVEVKPDDLAYIAFTSGSTGKPKGILGTHRPLSHFFAWHAETFGLNESDRFSMLSGIAHDPLMRDIFAPLTLGAAVCIPDPEQITAPGWLAAWMKQQEITVTHLTPAMGQLLSERMSTESEAIASLRYAFFGGDVLTHRDVDRMRQLAPDIACVNFYGATETPQAMGYYIVPAGETGDNKNPQIPIGRGIDGVQLLVLNPSQKLAGIGELGEIYIRTPYLARGYLGDEALTRERFIEKAANGTAGDRMYKTGDLGRYAPDGIVVAVGRADFQVKIRGFRIELGEIEAALSSHPGVKQSVAIAREDIPGEKRLVAYIVPKEETTSDVTTNWRDFLKEKLPDYMLPNAFVMLEALPLTPNGKIDRRALPVPEFQSSDREEGFVAPRDTLEVELAEIWQKILGIKSVGVKDNFFDVGGHSLLAVRLFSQIEKAFGKNLPLATLFHAPTVEQLANIVRSSGWTPPQSSLVPIRAGGTKKPLFCIHAVGGNVLSYKPVASYMDESQPVYGLQARGIDGQGEPHDRIEDMAGDYIKEMRTVQPNGPYFLAGHSLGGIVAFEIAQQLVRAGDRVALLAVFDTYGPLFKHKIPPFNYQLSIHKMNLSRLKIKDKLIYIGERIQWKLEGLIDKIAGKFNAQAGRSLPDELPEHFQRVEEANRIAVKHYVPQVYPGQITLLRAIERPTSKYHDPYMGWGELAGGGMEIVEVPGHHKTLILEPRVRFLAESLQQCINRAEAEQE